MAGIANATEVDYEAVQGGVPRVESTGRLTVLTHDYPGGGGMVVRSHKSIEDYGYVVLSPNGTPKKFKTALLKMFHGEPCEASSAAAGGDGYDREY